MASDQSYSIIHNDQIYHSQYCIGTYSTINICNNILGFKWIENNDRIPLQEALSLYKLPLRQNNKFIKDVALINAILLDNDLYLDNFPKKSQLSNKNNDDTMAVIIMYDNNNSFIEDA